jgi:hypothetical protein
MTETTTATTGIDGLGHMAVFPTPPENDWSLDGLKAECERFWGLANEAFYGGALDPVVFTFSPARGSYGHYYHKGWSLGDEHRSEVNLNTELFGETTLIEKIKTIVHEAGHAWQFKCGSPSAGNYHNREFADKMKEIGIPVKVGPGYTLSIEKVFIEWVRSNKPADILEPHRNGYSAGVEFKVGPRGGKVAVGRTKAPTKMKKWTCTGDPAAHENGKNINVRCAVELDATCDICGGHFERAE